MLLKKIVVGVPRRLHFLAVHTTRWVRYWRWFPCRLYYQCLDFLACRHALILTRFNLRCYARGTEYHPKYQDIWRAKQFGMLHPEVLLLLRYFALGVRHAVFEIGAFTGSVTVVVAKALKEVGGGPFFSVEVGGVKKHPILATNDIFGDLQRNVRDHGLADAVVVLNGASHFPHIRQIVEDGTKATGIDLLIVDADGGVERDFQLYRPSLNDGCILVVDDYLIAPEQNNHKMAPVKSWIDQEVATGCLQEIGVFGFSTWIGRYWKSAYRHIGLGKTA